ncbi:hypothetical protein GGI1_01062 [Acidithiobacillus sp. GGI-221]|nr:hypothetical protein GGI1_01062 [Acidithiobacillus sp. GGI-221]
MTDAHHGASWAICALVVAICWRVVAIWLCKLVI